MVTTLSVYELGDLYANYVAREKREEARGSSGTNAKWSAVKNSQAPDLL
jgi:hypothetical protein